MMLAMHLSFYIAEILLGIPCGYIMFKNRHIDDEKIIGRNNMISNIFFFIIVGVAIAGCVVLQINYNVIYWKLPNIWRSHTILLNDSGIKDEITRRIRKCFKN